MANEEQVWMLKQSAGVWNRWRDENPAVLPDLSEANLSWCNLRETDLRRADLRKATLSHVSLYRADLRGADLREANLARSGLLRARLKGANLGGADLKGADLRETDLREADLRQATLLSANLRSADLEDANLDKAEIGSTTFEDNDLSKAIDLETVIHLGPSTLSIDTLYRSKGQIPEAFLRGVGIPENLIQLMPSIVQDPSQLYACFISYGNADEDFARYLYIGLQDEGVRCWLAPESLKKGTKIRPAIDESARTYDKLLLILSQHSVESEWMGKEVETAFEMEHKRKQTVLFPVCLDDSVMETDRAWAANIRRTRHIRDFSNWKDHDAFQKAFGLLLRDLKMEKKEEV